MSRLQVGGYAVIIHAINESNIGRVVKLIEFVGDNCISRNWGKRDDFWKIECDGFEYAYFNPRNPIPVHPAQYLMPIGDKQTQDELAKEKELEHG